MGWWLVLGSSAVCFERGVYIISKLDSNWFLREVVATDRLEIELLLPLNKPDYLGIISKQSVKTLLCCSQENLYPTTTSICSCCFNLNFQWLFSKQR